jgi:hypothetical protein
MTSTKRRRFGQFSRLLRADFRPCWVQSAHGGVLDISATNSAVGTGGASSAAWNAVQLASDRVKYVRLSKTSCARTRALVSMKSVRFRPSVLAA